MLTDKQWQSIGYEPFTTHTWFSARMRAVATASLSLVAILAFVAAISGAASREFSATRDVVRVNLGEYP